MIEFTFSDCFAGIGGLRLSGEMAGGTCVFSSEIDPACREVYEANHRELPSGDLALADPRRVRPHDLCLASPPCTPFSQSGKPKGLADGRSGVLYTLFRFLARMQPTAALIENVRGLATDDGGRTLRFVLRTLRGLGYRTAWEVLPATMSGGCQLRRRLYVVASLRRTFRFGLLPRVPAGRLADILEPDAEGWLEPGRYTLLGVPRESKSSGMIFAGYLNCRPRVAGGNPSHPGTHSQQNRVWCPEGVGPTITSQDTTGRYWLKLAGGVRKFTRLEMAKMQGFPDTFRWVHPTRMVRQIGNSVHVPTVAAIVRGIAEQILSGSMKETRA